MRVSLAAVVLGSVAALGLPETVSAAPGELSPVEINTQGNNYGYWEYLPDAYADDQQWPLLIFLSGIGENGDGTVPNVAIPFGGCPYNETAGGDPIRLNSTDDLCGNLRWGPQERIFYQENGNDQGWDDVAHPFVVIAPQNPAPLYAQTAYQAGALDTFVQYLLDTYAIDPRRMYLTGMSIGGRSVVLSLQNYPNRFAAVGIMPGFGDATSQGDVCNWTRQNMWIFHGELDDFGAFSPQSMVLLGAAFDACPPPHPDGRTTIFEGAGHNVWARVIDPDVGMADAVLTTFTAGGVDIDVDPFDENFYAWLLRHDKPDVDAGADTEAPEDQANVMLTATTVDDDAITYTWTQTGGAALTLSGEGTDTLTITGLTPGVFTFAVLAVDADGQWDTDEVDVTISEVVAGTTTGGNETSGSSSGSSGSSSTSDGSSSTGGPPDTSGTTDAQTTGETGGDTGTASATGGDTDGTGSGTQGDSTTSTTAGSASASAGTTAPASTTAGSGGSSGQDTADIDGGTSDDGCSCRAADAGHGPGVGLWALGLLGLVRRRRWGTAG